jgi:hypothetical protein
VAAVAVIAVECSGRGVNMQQSAEETALMMGGGGEGVEAVAPSRAVLGDRRWGRQRRRQEREHQPRGGGDRDDVSGAAVGGVVFAAVATTAPSSLSSKTPPLVMWRVGGCFRRQERVQTHRCVVDGAVPDRESPSVLPRRQNVGPR